MKTIPSIFFRFYIVKTYFQTNLSFWLVGTYYLSSGNRSYFKKTCPWEEAVFPYRGNVFFNECFIAGSGTGFFISFFQRHLPEKAFFLSSGNVFLNESFIPAIGEGYFSLMKTVTLLESFFLLVETVTATSGNQFLKTELILAGDFLTSGNHFLPYCLIYFSRSPSSQLAETYFSVQKNSIVFHSELSFLLVKTVI